MVACFGPCDRRANNQDRAIEAVWESCPLSLAPMSIAALEALISDDSPCVLQELTPMRLSESASPMKS